MANAVYPKAKEAMLKGQINLLSSTIRLQMYGSNASYDPTDEFLSDIAGTKLGSPVTINSKSVENGNFTGSNGVFNIPTGTTATSVVVYVDTGTNSTSRLLSWLDTKADTSELQFISSGNPVQPYWDDPYLSIGG